MEVKFSIDHKVMIIEGRDLNKSRSKRHLIQTLTLQTTNGFVEMAGNNWNFFFEQLRI